MLFAVKWSNRPENRDTAIKRFKETGGPAPAGVNVIGRWHSLTQSWGIVICEADDATPIGQWCMEWTDVLEMEVTPVVDDEGAMPILSS